MVLLNLNKIIFDRKYLWVNQKNNQEGNKMSKVSMRYPMQPCKRSQGLTPALLSNLMQNKNIMDKKKSTNPYKVIRVLG